MKQVSIVAGLKTITDMVNQINQTFKPMTYVNGVNGDEIMIEPDKPEVGFITIRVTNQLIGEDEWDD